MLHLVFVLTFTWLDPGVGIFTERATFDTLAACEAAKEQKIAEKIVPDKVGMLHSRARHAACQERS